MHFEGGRGIRLYGANQKRETVFVQQNLLSSLNLLDQDLENKFSEEHSPLIDSADTCLV